MRHIAEGDALRAVIRNMTEKDVDGVGEVLFKAFNSVSTKHGYGMRIRNEQVGKVWAWTMLRYGQVICWLPRLDIALQEYVVSIQEVVSEMSGQLQLIRIFKVRMWAVN